MINKYCIIMIVLFLCSCSTSKKQHTPQLNVKSHHIENPVSNLHDINDLEAIDNLEAIDSIDENFSETTGNITPTAIPEEIIDEPSQEMFDQALEFCQEAQNLWQKGDLDNALQSLDQAYGLIIKFDTQNSPKLFQQKEDLRFVISKRILEIYASRNIVVNGTHNAIPITINKKVKREIKLFLTRERKFFEQSLARSGSYRPMMLKALKEAGLPPELSWLPLVESGFKIKALSKARALGLWQFIPSTGYMFGLNRNQFIDERLDPVKATDAAIEYLKKLHRLFGDWSTVLAAYNCGESRVLRLIRSQNINYLDNFWDLQGRLPSETARYVPRFLATLHIMNNLEKYGFDKTILNSPFEFETATISKQVKLKDIAKLVNSTEKHLSVLNPELRYKILPGEEYKVRIPKGTSEILSEGIASLKITVPPQRAYVYHKVRSGEALSTIARKYRTSSRAIARANGISKRNFIVAGKLLKIPRNGYTPSSYARSSKSRRIRKDLTSTRHIVRRGDSLWIIARKYGTTVTKIKSINNLARPNLRIGQRLKLPVRQKNIVANTETGAYYVKSGDSPFTIARQHNISLRQLLKLNSLSSRSTIYPGQKLYIK